MKTLSVLSTNMINSSSRYITASLKIYLSDGTILPITRSLIQKMSVSQETISEANPFDFGIQCGKLDISIYNENKQYSVYKPTNAYYNKMIKGCKVEYYNEIYSDEVTFEQIKIGTFYIDDIFSEDNDYTVSIICYDRLYEISSIKISDCRVQKDLTLYEAFVYVFTLAGLSASDYSIDTYLQTINTSYLFFDTYVIGNMLSALCKLGLCYVSDNVGDKLVVKSLFTISGTPFQLLDNVHMYSMDYIQHRGYLYSGIKAKVYNTYLANEPVDIISELPITIVSTNMEIDDIDLSNAPIFNIQSISILNSYNTRIIGSDQTCKSLSLNLTSVTVPVDCILVAKGIPIKQTSITIVSYNDTMKNIIGDKVLEWDSNLLQKQNVSDILIPKLLKLASATNAFVSISLRGMPNLEIGDIVNCTMDGETVNVLILNYTTQYDGTFDATILGILTTSLS